MAISKRCFNMAYSEANKRATMKYQKKAYDRLELKVKKEIRQRSLKELQNSKRV